MPVPVRTKLSVVVTCTSAYVITTFYVNNQKSAIRYESSIRSHGPGSIAKMSCPVMSCLVCFGEAVLFCSYFIEVATVLYQQLQCN